jgi:very-short-patch-repair endonuclease
VALIQDQLTQAISELSCANEISQLQPYLRDLIASALQKGTEAITEISSMLSIARHRVPLLLRLRGELKRLRHWVTIPYLDGLSEKACAGEMLREPLSQLSEYLSKMPDLVAFDSAKDGLDDLESRLLDRLVATGVSSSEWGVLLEISALSRWAENCLRASPELKSVSPSSYKSKRAALDQALKKKRNLESSTIMGFWAERQCALKGLRPSPLNVLRAQLVTRGPNSKRLREVIAVGAENGLFTLRPCWLTNPNTACQIFGLTPGLFDVVIFDEASQCPVEQAVPIVHRGKRVVVSGDEKQLPPTSFFLSFSGSSFEPEADLTTEAELSDEEIAERALEKQILNSKDLLTVCEPLLRSSYLDMHYRSEHPSLIEFSNHAFYGGRLQFPPARPTDAQTPSIEYREVSGIYESNQNRDEAKAVIELLQQIWKEEPCPTVGVVTFNAKQQDLIENLVQEKAIADADFRLRYESESAREEGRQQVGFFVKNLESVQGDERDVIIFSTTFGRDNTGAFKRFFGPINLEGGERRLNVAVTRAKKKVYVLTSMPVFEISDAFTSTEAFGGEHITGREYLQGYLLYSKAISERDTTRASEILKRARQLGFEIDKEGRSTSIDFESEFEIAVYEALKSRGITLDTQVGVAGFRIDLAVRHPDPNKGYLMGIECDGKAFHSSFSARARDIWREQILRSRGWRIHRIWSSDWWADPEFEIQKVIEAIQGYSV